MTEILLGAILNLFAIQASMLARADRAKARATVADYLRRHLRLNRDTDYLDLFDTVLELQAEADNATRLERAAQVAANLKTNLPRIEQYIFLLRYLELALAASGEDAAHRVTATVADELGFTPGELETLRAFVTDPLARPREDGRTLVHHPDRMPKTSPGEATGSRPHLARPDFRSGFVILSLPAVNAFVVSPTQGEQPTLDSLPLEPGPRLLPPGAVLRDAWGTGIYYSEIEAAFQGTAGGTLPLVFRGENLEFRYPGSDNGLHDFSFRETGGRMVGVMGVSGAGKSTLLSLLIGQTIPDSGRVLVDGLDVHRQATELEGIIGYVPQDDLLFEDLTVFDNLYYNACLCLAHLTPEDRTKRVRALLEELRQTEIAHLKVGSPLDKTISGGQRKRLNIALELIREPAILFVDEPTSGLSSADSENVMTLLRAQANKGRLAIVVIHQPSSRIFKMFDTLWIMDQGGRPIYDGHPLEAIVHFRAAVHQAGMDEYACPQCGQVNPEQIFEIIEARTVDESGQYTRQRRVSPQDWHQRYLEKRAVPTPEPPTGPESRPTPLPWRPGPWGQLGIFFRRNVKAHLANRQYLAVALLEPPLLALLTALLTRGARGASYVFMNNENLSSYFFISVIVALFLGLSVSAEEINRDRGILRRERFLHLSWPCYVAAKTLFQFLVVALQMLIFTLVGNSILEIPGMFPTTWLVLFSLAAVSCVLALNVSATFKNAVTVYILIPLLLVPQMMLGGSVIPYDDLIHREAGNRHPPLVADLMPSRWGYEALIVEQYEGNAFMTHFFADDCQATQADYLVDLHLPEVRSLADFPLLEGEEAGSPAEKDRRLTALANEIRLVEKETGLEAGLGPDDLASGHYDRRINGRVKRFLDRAANFFQARRQAALDRKIARENALRQRLGRLGFDDLKSRNFNKDIAALVLNRKSYEGARLSGDRVVQVAAPVCQPPESPWGQAPFLASRKLLGPWPLNTLAFNLGVLWLMTLSLYTILYFAWLPRLFLRAADLIEKLKHAVGVHG